MINIKKSYRALKTYMNTKLGIEEIAFNALTFQFMKDLISYMRDDMHYSTSYMYVAIRKRREIVHIAHRNGIIRRLLYEAEIQGEDPAMGRRHTKTHSGGSEG